MSEREPEPPPESSEGEPELPPETEPRPRATEYDNVDEYVDRVDTDVPEERREIRAGETTDDPGAGPAENA